MEKLLQVSPTLAQTLGLEEALVVQLLQEIEAIQCRQPIQFSQSHRSRFLPFWSDTQFRSVLKRLQAQGVIRVSGESPWLIALELPTDAPVSTPRAADIRPTPPPPPQPEPTPVYAMNETRQLNQSDDELAYLRQGKAQRTPVTARKTAMHSDWEPSEDFPRLLEFHDIPLQFALSELGKFRQYYLATDRKEISWDVRYLNWVQRAWHDSMNTKGRHDRQQATDGEPADSARGARSRVRDALRNIEDTDW
ncbi:DnaT-like ssDNA-binding domain-containing protein [Reinekea blandensis]|uniref:DnaT DNA-binding domain-containing protein n=1 Tax=Reinekea blandensis MED297 TaxID=314283 RepID=A4BGB5_9GAMM|nr:DnaT-like ssDNA-binding domain-containing protein [Reinekea blandensis]EAR08910.1 hypothetical protein MED297_04552 [Reinekea sp. MED297] [Reinekea blandensis MED297]